jgi:hypothetical protein
LVYLKEELGVGAGFGRRLYFAGVQLTTLPGLQDSVTTLGYGKSEKVSSRSGSDSEERSHNVISTRKTSILRHEKHLYR